MPHLEVRMVSKIVDDVTRKNTQSNPNIRFLIVSCELG